MVFGIRYFSGTYALACCLVFGIFSCDICIGQLGMVFGFLYLVFLCVIYAVDMVFGAVHCESEPATAKTIEPL